MGCRASQEDRTLGETWHSITLAAIRCTLKFQRQMLRLITFQNVELSDVLYETCRGTCYIAQGRTCLLTLLTLASSVLHAPSSYLKRCSSLVSPVQLPGATPAAPVQSDEEENGGVQLA